ncbi:MAG: lipopolysaccharide heptosyltransferase II [Desulfobacca sp.]|uniref:lipopolysaccharide heptosyltransferase II n=1 Tax=Desulfobacca sp. TaxID=2067990 RepID=UPI004049C627
MTRLPEPKFITIGDHHSPLPQAVQAAMATLTISRRRRFFPHQIRAILVRAANWLGDAILTLPALKQLPRFFPEARISVLALDRVAPVFLHRPEVAEIISYLPKPPQTHLRVWVQSLVQLRRRAFDLAIILPNSFESALIPRLAGIPHRVGYDFKGRSWLLTQRVQGPSKMAGLHQVYRHEGLLTAFGRIAADGLPELITTPAERDAAVALLRAAGWQHGQKLIGLSPGAAYGPAKQWFPDRFAAVATALQEKYGAAMVLLGAVGVQEVGQRLAAAMAKPPINLIGRTELRTAFAVLQQLDLLIANDSGLMHAAAALWTPVVAIFGSTDPFATGPFTPYASVLWRQLPCGPCRQRTCPEGHYRCLDLISVAEVTAQADYWLTRPS